MATPTIQTLLQASNSLPIQPPITTNSIRTFDPTLILHDAESTHIVIHPRFPSLLNAFLSHKRAHGSTQEKELYSSAAPDSYTWQGLVRRLVEKRPLVFVGSSDHTVLRDGRDLRNARAEWDANGRDAQSPRSVLKFEEYLSYDEIMLSSLLGVSGWSHFINDGNRFNAGEVGEPGMFEERGVIIGLVGARFERGDRMDSAFILPRVKGEPYMDVRLRGVFEEWFGGGEREEGKGFDDAVYKGRMKVPVEILLLEADARARVEGRKAWVYVVGLGLGVWQRRAEQGGWFCEMFIAALAALELKHIRTLEFAWIGVTEATSEQVVRAGREVGIEVVFSKRNPAEKLETDDLLVLSYAWDGNAFPGNEYWSGALSASGDPAAACMSTVGELHNPYVNPFTGRIKIAGTEGYQ